jgi:hypothetical protein
MELKIENFEEDSYTSINSKSLKQLSGEILTPDLLASDTLSLEF